MLRKQLLFLLLVLGVVCWSCTKPNIDFGADYLDNNYTNIVIVDTATPVVSTVFVDSFVTSNTGAALLGNYTDAYFGVVSASAYFPMAPPTFTNGYANTTYDSLELIFTPNKHYYGDTMLPLHMQVHQLAEPIVLGENSTSLYNVSIFAAGTLLANTMVNVRPSLTDSIAIKMSDDMGRQLLTLLRNQDEIVQSNEKFTQFFKGLKLSVGNNGCMLGIADGIVMRLYYKEPGVISKSTWVDFTVSDKRLQFNNIQVNRTGTALSGLSSTNNELASTTTQNAGFLQSATGSMVKITFPYIRDFLQVKNYLKILKAELIIKPLKNSYNGTYPLPPALRLSETTQLNQLGTDLTYTDATGTTSVLYGNLYIDNLFNENTHYSYDITSYINARIADGTYNRNGLLLSPPNPAFATQLNRLVLGNKANTSGAIQLRLYYLTISTQ